MTIAIVTDSTADLPADLIAKHQIGVVPLHILWGTESYRDGVDMDANTFYKRLEHNPELPRTSQPPPGDFADFYQKTRAAMGADSVVCITIAASLSGTYNSADAARALVDFPVIAVDSQTVSMGLGFAVLAAVAARDRGESIEAVAAAARRVGERAQVFFTVNTLEFLHRGGRIGGAQRLIGTALSIKPILSVQKGQVLSAETVRTRKRALARMAELARCVEAESVQIAVIEGLSQVEADLFAEDVTAILKPTFTVRSSLSPTLGVHTGPGVVGIAISPND